MKKVPDSGAKYRQSLPESRRVVVKIGSKVLVDGKGRPDRRRIADLVRQLAALHAKGYELVVVSSGAIAAGMEALGIDRRPESVPDLQMCAAVGQPRLMSTYFELFAAHRVRAGQLLLTHEDFERRLSLANMRRTLDHLLRRRVVPIVNENDAVADEEVKAYMSLGDNDHLAALLSRQVRADLVVMLSAVDGLRRPLAGGRTARVPFVEDVDRRVVALVKPPKAGGLSKGGMDSKLAAAAACARAGANVVIADGRRKDAVLRILAGEDEGTLFPATP